MDPKFTHTVHDRLPLPQQCIRVHLADRSARTSRTVPFPEGRRRYRRPALVFLPRSNGKPLYVFSPHHQMSIVADQSPHGACKYLFHCTERSELAVPPQDGRGLVEPTCFEKTGHSKFGVILTERLTLCHTAPLPQSNALPNHKTPPERRDVGLGYDRLACEASHRKNIVLTTAELKGRSHV